MQTTFYLKSSSSERSRIENGEGLLGLTLAWGWSSEGNESSTLLLLLDLRRNSQLLELRSSLELLRRRRRRSSLELLLRRRSCLELLLRRRGSRLEDLRRLESLRSRSSV